MACFTGFHLGHPSHQFWVLLFLLDMLWFRILSVSSPDTDCSTNTGDAATHGTRSCWSRPSWHICIRRPFISYKYPCLFSQHLNIGLFFFSLCECLIPAPILHLLTTVSELHLSSEQALLTALLIHVLSDNCTLGTASQPCAQDQGYALFQLSFSPAFLYSSLLIFFLLSSQAPCHLQFAKMDLTAQRDFTARLKRVLLAECQFPQHFSPFHNNTSILWYTGAHKWNAKK